jgi:Tol biopolymer transport system component
VHEASCDEGSGRAAAVAPRRALILAGLAGLLGVVPAFGRAAPPCTLDRATGTTIDPRPVVAHGYGTRWNFATNRIAFMQPNAAGYYRIYTAKPDGSDVRAVTDGKAALPPGHHGSESWYPSGQYLLFTAQKRDWSGGRAFGNPDFGALPGFGIHDDLWLTTEDGRQSWQLTDDANTRRQGVLLPVMSADGKQVAWTSRQPDKTYTLKIADLVLTPAPHLANIRTTLPGGPAFYELGSFTPDGRGLTYTSDQDTRNFWRNQIYVLDIASGRSTRLTQGNAYNEHPIAVNTPGGVWVVYMSARGVDRYSWNFFLGTDWWAVRPDGSFTKRLTEMNLRRRGNPEDSGAMQVATTMSISPSGDFFLGDIQDSLVKQTGLVKRVRFTCAVR